MDCARGEQATMRQPLSEGDLLSFSRLGIPAEILLAAGVCRVTGKEAHDTFGIRFTGDLSGIIFPYSDPTTGKRVSARLRRDNPEVDSDGKPRHKYICAWGDRRHLFFPPGVGGLLPDTSVPVVMVEAEKSALAIAAVTARTHRSLLSIGCGGCWGWRGKTGILTNGDGRHIDERGPLPDFSLVTWEGREVFVCFDSNSARNPKVRQARYALAQEIHGRGGRVRLVELPKLANVNGPDDYIGLSGDEAFLTLLGSTASLAHSALAEASKTLEELEVDTTPAKDPETACRLLQVVAGVENPDHRRVLEKRSAKVLHWSTSEVRSGVRARITERLESAAIAKEAARKAYLRSLKLDRSMLIR